jgi:hypothetical protein
MPAETRVGRPQLLLKTEAELMRVLQFAKRSVVTVALLSAAVIGCSNDPLADAPFNPAGTSADLEAMNSSFSSPTFESFSTFSWMFGDALGGSPIISHSVSALSIRGKSTANVREAAARVASRMAAMMSTPRAEGLSTSEAAMAIPATVAGKTFVYDAASTTYVPSDRPLLASNKVRFILYEVEPGTFAPRIPLVETGYVDLTDLSQSTTQSARIQVISGSTTYIDYTVTGSSGVSSARVTVMGYVTDGTTQANITMRSVMSLTSGLTLTYSVNVPSRNVSISLSMGISSLTVPGTPITVNMTLRGPNGTVSITGQFTETAGAFNIRINGDAFATISVTNASVSITRIDGAPLTEDEYTAVNGVFEMQDGAFGSFDQMMAPVGAMFSE